jgi:hypothetical protein
LWYSAGIGVITAARKTMARMLGGTDSALSAASKQFWLVDRMASSMFSLFPTMMDFDYPSM